jgi:phage FluMu gp28-like protein
MAIEDIQYDRDSNHPEALLKSGTITFSKGSRVIAVPGKPDTVRGFSANLLFTEFAFFEDPDRTWRAALPSITNPLRGGLKKVRIISTPNGQGNKFHDLWTKNYQVAGAKWSCHRVTIHDAVEQGLPVDIEELRAGIDDPDGWAQEYLCEFIDTANVLLPY